MPNILFCTWWNELLEFLGGTCTCDTPDGYANAISELIFSAVFGLPYYSAYASKLLITSRALIPMEQNVRSAHR